MRHEDIDTAGCLIRIQPRGNVNGARAKSGPREVPIAAGLLRLYADYLFGEYGALDSDYVVSDITHSLRRHLLPPAPVPIINRLYYVARIGCAGWSWLAGGTCGRCASTASRANLLEQFHVDEDNAAPAMVAPVVIARAPLDGPKDADPVRQLRLFKWGLLPN